MEIVIFDKSKFVGSDKIEIKMANNFFESIKTVNIKTPHLEIILKTQKRAIDDTTP